MNLEIEEPRLSLGRALGIAGDRPGPFVAIGNPSTDRARVLYVGAAEESFESVVSQGDERALPSEVVFVADVEGAIEILGPQGQTVIEEWEGHNRDEAVRPSEEVTAALAMLGYMQAADRTWSALADSALRHFADDRDLVLNYSEPLPGLVDGAAQVAISPAEIWQRLGGEAIEETVEAEGGDGDGLGGLLLSLLAGGFVVGMFWWIIREA